jgi:hypothetical protein
VSSIVTQEISHSTQNINPTTAFPVYSLEIRDPTLTDKTRTHYQNFLISVPHLSEDFKAVTARAPGKSLDLTRGYNKQTWSRVCGVSKPLYLFSMIRADVGEMAGSTVDQYCSVSEAMKLINQPFNGDRRKVKEFIDNVIPAFKHVRPEDHGFKICENQNYRWSSE